MWWLASDCCRPRNGIFILYVRIHRRVFWGAFMTAGVVRLFCLLAAAGFSQASAHTRPPVLPGADGTVCEFVAANAGHKATVDIGYLGDTRAYSALNLPFQDMLVKRAAADIDGDGEAELLDTFSLPAGLQSTVYGLSPGYAFQGMPDGVDPQEDVRWADGDGWLFFRGQWHLVQFKDRARNLAVAVTTYDKSGAVFACKFNAEYREELPPTGHTAIDAAFAALKQQEETSRAFSAFAKGGGRALTAHDRRYIATLPGGFKTDVDTLYGQGISREISVDAATALFVADMNGDGDKERFAKLVLSSGATPPCGAVYFELLPSEGKDAPDALSRDLWRSLQGVSYGPGGRFPASCGVSHSIVEIDGHGYVYTVEADTVVKARRLSRLAAPANILLPTASSTFLAHHDIVYDMAKGGLTGDPR